MRARSSLEVAPPPERPPTPSKRRPVELLPKSSGTSAATMVATVACVISISISIIIIIIIIIMNRKPPRRAPLGATHSRTRPVHASAVNDRPLRWPLSLSVPYPVRAKADASR